jgi:pimeloyl-ACP methyl ester carboxylesterase
VTVEEHAMDALRTPDERFHDLPGYPWPPTYVDDLPGFEGLRAHYLDLGPKDAQRVFLCLHGEPSWSYLYRRMIPVFLEAGARVVAPDFFGFGRSDKPVRDEDYSFGFHRGYLLALVERLELERVTLVVQDWGGLIGLTLPVDAGVRPRLERLLVMNTAIAVGESPGPGFDAWRAYAASQPDLPIGELIARGTPHLTPGEVAAYDAPYPDASFKAGARAFPRLVMTSPEMEGVAESKAAARFWAEDWDGPTFMAYGAADPVLGPPVMEQLRTRIRGCPPAMVIEGGGHFVQEWGEPIARAALAHFADVERAL